MKRRDFLKAAATTLAASSAFGALDEKILQKVPYKTLNDGNKIPLLGYGTFLITDQKSALDAFLRHLK